MIPSPFDRLLASDTTTGTVAEEPLVHTPLAGEFPEQTTQRVIKQNLIKGRQLASYGVPTYNDKFGDVQAVTDETGAPMTGYSKKTNTAVDSFGMPKSLLYTAPGQAPKLGDAYEGAETKVDQKTGDIFKVRPGLPKHRVGLDESVVARNERAARDKELSQMSSALGRALTLDEATYADGNRDLKTRSKAFQASLKADFGKDFKIPEGTDWESAKKLVASQYDAALKAKDATATNWFSSDLKPEALTRRQTLTARKAAALAAIDDLAQRGERMRQQAEIIAPAKEQKKQIAQSRLEIQLQNMEAKGIDTTRIRQQIAAREQAQQPLAAAQPQAESAPQQPAPIAPDEVEEQAADTRSQWDYWTGKLGAAVDSYQSLNWNVLALGAKLFGADESAAKFAQWGQFNQDEAAKFKTRGADKIEDIDGAGDFAYWLGNTIVELAPQIAETVSTAIAGGVIGSAAAPGLGTGGGALAGIFGKQAIKKLVKAEAKQLLAGGMEKEAAKQTAELVVKEFAKTEAGKVALTGAIREVGAKTGAFLGAFGSSYKSNAGEIYGNLLADPNVPEGKAELATLLFSAPSAALDSIVPGGVVGKMFGGAVNAASRETAKKFATRIAAELGYNMATEGATEGGQALLGFAAKRWAKDQWGPLTDEEKSEFWNSVAAGAAGGGLLGTAGVVAEGRLGGDNGGGNAPDVPGGGGDGDGDGLDPDAPITADFAPTEDEIISLRQRGFTDEQIAEMDGDTMQAELDKPLLDIPPLDTAETVNEGAGESNAPEIATNEGEVSAETVNPTVDASGLQEDIRANSEQALHQVPEWTQENEGPSTARAAYGRTTDAYDAFAGVKKAAPTEQASEQSPQLLSQQPKGLPPLQSPVRENKAKTSIVLPNGDVVVGGRFHGETFEYAEALGAATGDELSRGVASFTTPDGRTWNLQGADVPSSGKIIDLGELQKGNLATTPPAAQPAPPAQAQAAPQEASQPVADDKPEKGGKSGDDTEQKKVYRYEMRSRPPSIGTHPKEGLIGHEEGGDRHGFITYNRPLTDKEIYDYELRRVDTSGGNDNRGIGGARPRGGRTAASSRAPSGDNAPKASGAEPLQGRGESQIPQSQHSAKHSVETGDDVTWLDGSGREAVGTIESISQNGAWIDYFGMKQVPLEKLTLKRKSNARVNRERIEAEKTKEAANRSAAKEPKLVSFNERFGADAGVSLLDGKSPAGWSLVKDSGGYGKDIRTVIQSPDGTKWVFGFSRKDGRTESVTLTNVDRQSEAYTISADKQTEDRAASGSTAEPPVSSGQGRDVTKPEQMSMSEWVAANGPAGMSKSANAAWHSKMDRVVRGAIKERKPVSVELANSLPFNEPDAVLGGKTFLEHNGYTREGELYVFKGEPKPASEPSQSKSKTVSEANAKIAETAATSELRQSLKDEVGVKTPRQIARAEWMGGFKGTPAEKTLANDVFRHDYERIEEAISNGRVTSESAVRIIQSIAEAGAVDANVAKNFEKRILKPSQSKDETPTKPSQTITGSNEQTGSEMPVQQKAGEATPFVPESGIGSVYEGTHRGEKKWFVQRSEKRGFGDEIHDTKAEADKSGALEYELVQEKIKRAERAKQKEEDAAKVQAEKASTPLGRFLSSLTPIQKGRAEKVLGVKLNSGGKVKTRAEIIEDEVADGSIVKTIPLSTRLTPLRRMSLKGEMERLFRDAVFEKVTKDDSHPIMVRIAEIKKMLASETEKKQERVLFSKDESFRDAAAITAIGLDYAQFLISSEATQSPSPTDSLPADKPTSGDVGAGRGESGKGGALDIVKGMLDAAGKSIDELKQRITNVRQAPYVEGQKHERILFNFDGVTHSADLKGRNKDLAIGFGEAQDKAIAARALLDGDAKPANETKTEAISAPQKTLLTFAQGSLNAHAKSLESLGHPKTLREGKLDFGSGIATLDGRITIDVARLEEKTKGMSEKDRNAFVQQAIAEEVIHVGALKWESEDATRKGQIEQLVDDETEIVNSLSESYTGWGKLSKYQQGHEVLRVIIQGKSGITTEATFKMLKDFLAWLKTHVTNLGKRTKEVIEGVERVLGRFEEGSTVSKSYEISFESASGERVTVSVSSRPFDSLSQEMKEEVRRNLADSVKYKDGDFEKWNAIATGKAPVTVWSKLNADGEISSERVSIESPENEAESWMTRGDLHDAKYNADGQKLRDKLLSKKKAVSDAASAEKAAADSIRAEKERKMREYEAAIRLVSLPSGKRAEITVPAEGTKGEGSITLDGTRYGNWFISKRGKGGKFDPVQYHVTHIPSGLGVGKHSSLDGAKDEIRAFIHAKVREDWKNPSDLTQDELKHIQEVGRAIINRADAPSYFTGERISSTSPSPDDARYLELAKDPEKNKAELQRMVDEAAKAAGYGERNYQGSPVNHGDVYKKGKFNDNIRFSDDKNNFGFYFTDSKQEATRYATQNAYNGRIVSGVVREVFLKTKNPLDFTEIDPLDGHLIQGKLEQAGVNHELFDPDEPDVWRHFMDGDASLAKAIQKAGYDSVKFREGIDDFVTTAVFKSSQIKLADPVTRDKSGKVIPLSQRFNPNSDSILYSTEPEKQPASPDATSIKNAVTDIEREKAGLPPAPEGFSRSQQDVWDVAMAKVRSDAGYQERLINELKDSPRLATDVEQMVVLHALRTEKNKFNSAVAAINETNGNPDEAAQWQRQMNESSDRMQDILDVARTTGTFASHALSIRKAMVESDFTLAGMTAIVRAKANGGKPLTEDQQKYVEELEKKFKDAEKKMQEAQAKIDEYEGTDWFEVVLGEIQANEAKSREFRSASKSFSDDLRGRADKGKDAALAFLSPAKGLSSTEPEANAVKIPPQVRVIFNQFGLSLVVDGNTDLESFTKGMVKEYGENVKPYVADIFKSAKAQRARLKFKKGGKEIKPPETPESVVAGIGKEITQRDVWKLVKAHIEAGAGGGVKGEGKAVMAAAIAGATKDLQAKKEGITEREVRDLFSGYGKTKFPSRDAVLTKLREVDRLSKLASAIEDAMQKESPKKSGAQRDKATQAVRDMMKQLVQAMRENGIESVSGEQRMKTSLDAAKTRMRNHIEDLQRQLKTGEKTPKRQGIAYDEEANDLKRQVESLREQVRAIEGRPELSEEQKLRNAISAVERSIKDLDEKIQNGDTSVAKKAGVTSPQLEFLRAERDAMRGFLNEMKKADVVPVSEEQKALDRALVLREHWERVLAGEATPSKAMPKEALSQLEEDARLEIAAMRKMAADIRRESLPKKDVEKVKEEAIVKALERAAAEYEKRVKEADLSNHGKKYTVDTERVAKARAARDAAKNAYDAMLEAAKPKLTEDEKWLATAKKAIETRRKKLIERIVKKDFGPTVKKDRPTDKELDKARYDYEKVKEDFHRKTFEWMLQNRSFGKRMMDRGQEIINTARAIITGIDFSAVLRQGAFIGMAHPSRMIKAMIPMFKAFRSEQYTHEINARLKERPNAALYKKGKLFFSDQDSTSLNKMEEQFMSRWASKIPFVAGSARAYSTFLNVLRADSFDAMVETLSMNPKAPTTEEVESIAGFINKATGRGYLGQKGEAAGGFLATVFFSPRLAVSRFQLLAGVPMFSGTARTKYLIAKEYARFLAGVGVVYALASMAQDDDDPPIETDPRSSDFGKVRFGNTRLDPMAGIIQPTVLLSRLASGETKTIKGVVKPIRGENLPYGSDDSSDVAWRFLRTKLAPAVGSAFDIVSGKNVVGQPTTPGSVAIQNTIPMSVREIKSIMEEQGLPSGAILSLLAVFGMGMNTFDTDKPKGGFSPSADAPVVSSRGKPPVPAMPTQTTPKYPIYKGF